MRYIAVDIGKNVSGVVIGDIDNHELTIKHMECHEGKDLVEHVTTHLIPEWSPKYVVYENTYIGRGKSNYTCMRIQTTLRKAIKDMKDISVRSLLPSQKISMLPGKKHRDRKKQAEKYVSDYLANHDDHWSTVYQSMTPRKHDVADAVLMLLYVASK